MKTLINTLLQHTSVSLTHTDEHRLVKRKWWAVVILITGGLLLAAKAPIPLYIPYILLFFGHGGMLHSFYIKRDIPMVIVNLVWLIIDGIGTIRWFGS
jgi:hypothetical protein